MKFRVCLTALTLAFSAGVTQAHAALPVYGFTVVHSYPHDPDAFTEGLFYRSGYLYESTGLEGASSVRKVELKTGKVVTGSKLPNDIFGEGISDWGDKLIGLTWKTQIGYVLDIEGFVFKGRFDYPGEGWGLTHNATELVMSDGTPELRFLDPDTLKEKRRIKVTAEGKPIDQLNELEWVEGEIFANIWQTDRIARIDPKTGRITGWIDLSGLLPQKEREGKRVDVLNGIAYDAATKRLFVTGKLWPKLYEITLKKK
ncbi:MAG TPA: glutaminyl-peptide cyclotransferase [Burkholderiaceae bacterium]|jgi:glutamine cyclotransferase